MAKKAQTNIETEERAAIQEEKNTLVSEDEFSGDSVDGAFKFDTDFDVEDEYKVPPLIPSGTYEGAITNVQFIPEDNALAWTIALRADDDVLMSDNEMPVSGNSLVYKNWFPRSGDELLRTKTGKMNKRQAKINMIKDFQDKMRVNMSTPDAILNGVSNAEWIGLEVIVEVETREWEGRLSNQIKNIKAA
jgi:hypothetical protein